MELNKKTYLDEKILKIKIYRDTLDFVISKLENNGLNIKIKSGNYIFNSLDELRQHRGNKISSIIIEGNDPNSRSFEHLFIHFYYDECSITISGSDKFLLIGYELLNEIKKQRPGFFVNILRNRLYIVGMILSIGWLILSNKIFINTKSLEYWLFYIAGVALVNIFFYGLSRINVSTRIDIELQKKHELNFLENNREKLVMDLIKVSFGGVLGYTGKYIIDFYSK